MDWGMRGVVGYGEKKCVKNLTSKEEISNHGGEGGIYT